jgi:type VI secretion system protein VasI
MYLSTGCHLASGHGGYGTVEYRFDDNPAGKRSFDASTDNRALGLWNGRKSIPLIKQMLGADKAIFRFTPYGNSPVTAKFGISGLAEAIQPLRDACHW